MTAPPDAAVATGPDQTVATASTLSCGCPSHRGRSITDQAAHDAWHALVVEQGGPAGVVDAVTLRAARGFKTETLHAETVLDVLARKSGRRASGKLRRAARGES